MKPTKRVLIVAGIVGVLVLATIVATLGLAEAGVAGRSGGTFIPSFIPGLENDAQGDAPEGNGMDEQGERAETPVPQDQATISPDQARQVVLAANPGATVTDIRLEKIQGAFVYEATLNNGKQVQVNAKNGQIIQTPQSDGGEEDNGDQGD